MVNADTIQNTGLTITQALMPGDQLACQAELLVGGQFERPVTSPAVTVKAPTAFRLGSADDRHLVMGIGKSDTNHIPICGNMFFEEGKYLASIMVLDPDTFSLTTPVGISFPYGSCVGSFVQDNAIYQFVRNVGFLGVFSGASFVRYDLDSLQPQSAMELPGTERMVPLPN